MSGGEEKNLTKLLTEKHISQFHLLIPLWSNYETFAESFPFYVDRKFVPAAPGPSLPPNL